MGDGTGYEEMSGAGSGFGSMVCTPDLLVCSHPALRRTIYVVELLSK